MELLNYGNHFRYPATLTMALQDYVPDLSRSKSCSRPLSVLEEEITGDIYSEECENILAAAISTAVTDDELNDANGDVEAVDNRNKLNWEIWVILIISIIQLDSTNIWLF